MAPDDDSDVFQYGDRTIFQLRTQEFAIENDYGTMIGPSAPVLPVVDTPPLAEDSVSRLEQKLDLALRQLAALQQKVDSIDTTLARLLNR